MKKKILLSSVLALGIGFAQAQWGNPGSSWVYDFGTATGTYTNSSGSPASSVSGSRKAGFLPLTSGGNAGVYISGAATSGSFILNGDHTLTAKLPTSNITRFSVHSVPSASDVVMNSFTIKFSDAVSAKDGGSYTYAIGNYQGNLFNPISNNSVYRSSSELFTALKWTLATAANSTAITFAYRLGSDKSSTTTYTTIDNTTFAKGGTYQVKIYCNNSSSNQTYTVGANTYTLPSNTFNIWVNNTQVGSNFPRSIEVNGTTGLSSGTSIAMANGTVLNSFLFSPGGGSANATGSITLSDFKLIYSK